MTQRDILRITQEQLAIDMNCTQDDLMCVKQPFIFTEAKDNPGRRPFPRDERHFSMITMGNATIVSATPDVLDIVKPMLEGKTRDEGFSMPFVHGHGISFLPDLKAINHVGKPEGFDFEIVERDNIPALYEIKGFNNAIQYDVNHPRPDVLAWLAKKNGMVVGMAGCSADSATMWQIGIDVLPEHRGCNLAAYLVTQLTREIFSREYVAYYTTSISNIASQRVAHRSGYSPAWATVWKGRFDGFETAPSC